MDSPAVPDNTVRKIRTMRRCAGYPGAVSPLAIERCDEIADNKTAAVMKKKVKGTTYLVSSFFNTAAKETIFDKLQHTLKTETLDIRNQIAEKDSKVVNINSFVGLARKYTSFEKLTPGMLHELVEKIIVHEGDKSSGYRIQKIEIYYSFVGNLESSHVVAQRTQKTPAA